jgi:outer membrane protein assembly factor BamB
MKRLIVATVLLLLSAGVGLAAVWAWNETKAHEVRGSARTEFVTREDPSRSKRPRKTVKRIPWTTYGFDWPRTHSAPDFQHRPPYRVLWAKRTGYFIEFPPVIAYGRVYLEQLKGRFYAYSAATGRTLWRKNFGQCSAASPTIARGVVYEVFVPLPCTKGDRSRPGAVIAMNAITGHVIWRLPIASESSPLLLHRTLYFGAWDHRLYALDVRRPRRKPRVRWTFVADAELNSGPAYAHGTIFIGSDAGTLYAVNARNGHKRWEAHSFSHFGGGREYFYATPAVAYGRVYIPNADGTVYAYGEHTGHLLWAKHVGTYVYTAPAVWNRTVYVGTYDGKFLALDAATGDVRWSFDAPASIHGAPTVMDGLVYFSTCGMCGQHGSRYAKLGPRRTFALDARTGKRVWTFPDGKYSPIVADSARVYLVGKTRLYGLEPADVRKRRAVRAQSRPRK